MKNKTQGFTLIELLIVIFILSLLMFTGTFTYSMLMNRWDKELGSFNEISKQSKNSALLQTVISGIYPHIVVDNKKKPSFFFIGGENSLLSVTRASLFNDQEPEIFRLSTVAKTNGRFDLIYQSVSLNNIFLTNAEQEVVFENEVVLFQDLLQVKLNYLGWSHYSLKVDAKPSDTPNWFTSFSGIDNQLMPEGIELIIKSEKGTLMITEKFDPESFRWLSPYFEDSL